MRWPLIVPAIFLLFIGSHEIKSAAFPGTGAPYNPKPDTEYLVQYNYTRNSGGPFASASIQNVKPINAGDFILFAINASGSTITSVNDTSGNSYSNAGNFFFYAANVNSAAALANTITVTFSPSYSGSFEIYFAEYHGIVKTSPLDAFSFLTGTSTAFSGAITTSNANDLIIAFDGSVSNTAGFDNMNFTYLTPNQNTFADLVTNSAGTYTLTGTVNPINPWGLVIAAFKIATPSQPPIVLHDFESSASSGAISSINVKMTNTQVAGNTNILTVSWNSTTKTISSVTDTAGNTYVQIPTDSPKKGTGITTAMYYAKNIASSAAGANSVTVTFSGTVKPNITVSEYSGLSTTSPLDQHTASTGTGTSVSAGSVTTAFSNELIFSAVGDPGTTQVITGVNSNFRPLVAFGTNTGNLPWDYPADLIVTNNGTYGNTFTLSTSKNWAAITASFH